MITKRKITLIAVVIVFAVIATIAALLLQKNLPAEKGSVTSNAQVGISQGGSGVDTEGQETGSSTRTPPPAKRSNAELFDAILKEEPTLLDKNNQPVFSVINAVRTQNAWYVVTIKHKDPTVTPAKVILKDSGGSVGLVIIAGPGTRFDREDIALPDEVWKVL